MVPLVVGKYLAVPTMIHEERSPRGDQAPVSVSPADEDMSVEEHEAIMVCDVGMGAPWLLTEGTEVEFIIDTGFQVTFLVGV